MLSRARVDFPSDPITKQLPTGPNEKSKLGKMAEVIQEIEQGSVAKDLFSGAVGGVAQVLIGTDPAF